MTPPSAWPAMNPVVDAFCHWIGLDYFYEWQRWGTLGHFLSVCRLVDTNGVRQLHWNINTWTDDEVLAWKQSYMTTCSSIEVAGAIFASVGLTALQLPNMDSTHWTARALLTCSMILGVLSVIFAASQQSDMGMLNKPLDIRLFLSRGKAVPTQRGYRYRKPFALLPLESSVAALKQFDLPKVVLNLAVLLYIVGVGVYLLYAWLYRVEPAGGRDDFRNVFIAFAATVGVVYLYVAVVGALAYADNRKRTEDFDLDRTTTFAKPASQVQLEEWLRALQDMQSTTLESANVYIRLQTAVDDLKAKWDADRDEFEHRKKVMRTAQKNSRKRRAKDAPAAAAAAAVAHRA
ncbi:hypothetical protein AYO21_04705 [Fonsecaea monophora]|uniref:Uncharacterized protein n=1 Tax=Fonsecaea monophora TaxID=254056 RepID=A0A177FCB6_9EURO|nr:hypothetical protein AYO21_04705 [Fonsecaea monophora]KAH0839112.1 hypothetical protein FOPE_05485 [Fonsecaea pedrosoi]OAG41092.1 hypothetical protein AYO21_04705 [Fonsecaea monophora]